MGKSGLYGTADAAPRPVDFLRKPAPGRFASRGETPKRLSPHPFCGVREKNVLHGRFFTFERPAFSGSRMRYGNRFTRGLNARDFPKSCLRRRLRRLTPALPGLRVLFGSLALPPSLKLWRDKPGLPCGFAVLTPARIVVFYSPPARSAATASHKPCVVGGCERLFLPVTRADGNGNSTANNHVRHAQSRQYPTGLTGPTCRTCPTGGGCYAQVVRVCVSGTPGASGN